jgi:hypothetical protein
MRVYQDILHLEWPKVMYVPGAQSKQDNIDYMKVVLERLKDYYEPELRRRYGLIFM